MPVKDDSLVAQYIRAIENPDSVGFRDGIWEVPPKGKGFDINGRGFGVDVIKNIQANALTNDRPGRWLSVKEERNLGNNHIQSNQEILKKWTASPYILRQEPSEEKKAMALGMLYRGDGIGSIINNPSIRDIYYSGSDKDMQNVVSDFYTRKRKFPQRAKLHNQFFNNRKSKETSKFQLEVPQYVSSFKYDEGGSLDNPDWDNLSISDKSEMMKVAIANGITTLPEIRRTYNEFAKGGRMNASQGYSPSDSIKKKIANWEGSSMKTNRSFEDEARDFNRVIPSEVRDKLTQQQKDALYSYGYNVGMGRLKERVVPILTAYTEGKASKEDVQRAMWASRDNELRGLTTRRNTEREMFGGNYRTKFTGTGKLGIHIDPSEYIIPSNYFNNFNAEKTLPQIQMPNGMDTDPETLYKTPTIDETLFEKPAESMEEIAYNPQEDKMEGIRRLGNVLGIMGDDSVNKSLGILDYVGRIYS